MARCTVLATVTWVWLFSAGIGHSRDHLKEIQTEAMESGSAAWGHWGTDPGRYSTWTSHSNRLIPIYSFGIDLNPLRAQGTVYGRPEALKELYGQVPAGTLQSDALYFDQTDVYHLQKLAADAGKKYIVLVVFDGMDWQTTQAAATYQQREVKYQEGRGTGLKFLDYDRTKTDYGFCVTSPHHDKAKFDVDAQLVIDGRQGAGGGYDPQRGGPTPWDVPASRDYLIGRDRGQPHCVTDSASSATSLTCGIKTYNAAINFNVAGRKVEPIGRRLQRERKFSVGIVTSVPISHATPAAAYANNVTRNDYQDLTRDLLGLPSAANRDPLPGADVVLGAGWGCVKDKNSGQGDNFVPGNIYAAAEDLHSSDADHGGRYVVAQRTSGQNGAQLLDQAARRAAEAGNRLLGFFGTEQAHLPFRTADGQFDPTLDVKGTEVYQAADIDENPTLAEMTESALKVLETNDHGFWLMIEAGDVDWANHANNIDNSVGAVISGDEAFAAMVRWIEKRDVWDQTAVIVTSDHGHYLVLRDPAAIAGADR